MKTIIERKFKDYGQQWEEVTVDEAIHDLESGGYWKQGTTRAMLEQGTELWTPFAQYRLKGSGAINGLGSIGVQVEQELRLEIKRHLDKCNKQVLPKVCKIIESAKGYQVLEQRIISMVIKDQITPSAAISHIELEG